MKKLFSEQNLAGLLFILVLLTFSFAHEDSKKRSPNYNLTSSPIIDKADASVTTDLSQNQVDFRPVKSPQ